AGVTQRVDSRSDSQPGNLVKSGQALGGNAELTFQIEGTPASSELDHVSDIVDVLKRGLSFLALDQAQDVFVQHVLAKASGDSSDELIPTQDAFDIAIVEDALGPRKPQRRSGDRHRGIGRGRPLAVVKLPAAPLESVGE